MYKKYEVPKYRITAPKSSVTHPQILYMYIN